MLDKKSKVIFIIFLVLTLLTIAATFQKMIVTNDFVIIDDTEEVSEEGEGE